MNMNQFYIHAIIYYSGNSLVANKIIFPSMHQPPICWLAVILATLHLKVFLIIGQCFYLFCEIHLPQVGGHATSLTTSSPSWNFGYVTRTYSFPSFDICVSRLMFSLKCNLARMCLKNKEDKKEKHLLVRDFFRHLEHTIIFFAKVE